MWCVYKLKNETSIWWTCDILFRKQETGIFSVLSTGPWWKLGICDSCDIHKRKCLVFSKWLTMPTSCLGSVLHGWRRSKNTIHETSNTWKQIKFQRLNIAVASEHHSGGGGSGKKIKEHDERRPEQANGKTQALREAQDRNKAYASATAQLVPWAKMATVTA